MLKNLENNCVLSENVRLCERMLDDQDRQIEALNRRIVLIVIFSISMCAYVYGLGYETFRETITQTADETNKDILNTIFFICFSRRDLFIY